MAFSANFDLPNVSDVEDVLEHGDITSTFSFNNFFIILFYKLQLEIRRQVNFEKKICVMEMGNLLKAGHLSAAFFTQNMYL